MYLIYSEEFWNYYMYCVVVSFTPVHNLLFVRVVRMCGSKDWPSQTTQVQKCSRSDEAGPEVSLVRLRRSSGRVIFRGPRRLSGQQRGFRGTSAQTARIQKFDRSECADPEVLPVRLRGSRDWPSSVLFNMFATRN